MEAILALLRFSTPVALAALGETVQQKSGVINIGLEGLMLTSAYASMAASLSTGNPWLGLAAGIAAAVALGMAQCLFVVKLRLDQVVVGTAVNLFALGLTGTLFRMSFGSSGKLISVPKLPQFLGGVDVLLFLAPVVAVALWWVFAKTKWGLAVRAVGEYPPAATAAGLKPSGIQYQAALVGSLFAGLAGSYYTLGITGSFAENTIGGRGFVAIAMVTFGRWNPIAVLAASLLVGLTEQSQFLLQAMGTGIPFQVFTALPYLVALAVLALAGKGRSAPQWLGRAGGTS